MERQRQTMGRMGKNNVFNLVVTNKSNIISVGIKTIEPSAKKIQQH